jgi:hypothetical protein
VPTPTPDPFAQIRNSLPWANDGVTDAEQRALFALSQLASRDPALATTLATYSWVKDGIAGQHEVGPLNNLGSLAETDVVLVERVARFPWIADGLNDEESMALDFFALLAAKDTGLAAAIVRMPWVADDIKDDERKALQNLNALAFDDVSLAKRAAAFPWVVDGIAGSDEWATLGNLANVTRRGHSLGTTILGYPWLSDDLTIGEARSIYYLSSLSDTNLSLANQLASMPFLNNSFEEHDENALSSILGLAAAPNDLAELTRQSWYKDGLDDLEAAFVSTLADRAQRSPEEFRAIVPAHQARTQQFTLPLAGDVQIFVFRRTEFHPHDPVMTQVEDAARAMEGLMGVPFPRREIIVLYIDPLDLQAVVGDVILAQYVGTHLLVTRPEVIQGDYRHALAHEVAHYYWSSRNAALWFREGGADFLASYALDRSQQRSLADRRSKLDAFDLRTCAGRGIETIQRLIDLLAAEGYTKHSESPYFLCNYILGEFLLLNFYQVMGAEGSTAAWGELYLLAESEKGPLTETEIYRSFLRNTPADRVDEFKEVYNRWHGGDSGR